MGGSLGGNAVFFGFALMAVGFALPAVLCKSVKKSVISLWITGFSTGAIYLWAGVEYLGIIQWILGTLGAICFLFYAPMLPEDLLSKAESKIRWEWLLVSSGVIAILIGIVFFAAQAGGAGGQNGKTMFQIRFFEQSLASLGKELATDQFITLELLGFSLLITLVGASLLSRPEKEE